MNTVLLVPALFSSDGGIERMMRLYVRAVGELTAGGRVDVIALNDSAITAAQLAPYRTPRLAAPIACGRNKLLCAWHVLRRARRSRRLICGHIHLLRLAHLARRLAPALEVWLVAHGLEVWRDFTPGERRALSATHRILCVSRHTRQQLAARCPELAASHLCVQPNALDPQFSLPVSSGQPVPGLILSVARLNAAEAYKGVDHLIAALPLIRAQEPAAHLRIVGDGDDRPRLERLAAGCSVAAHIHFAGRVGDGELRGHFNACQLFALPSGGEGFGLVYLEALAHGKPCVAAGAGGAAEILDGSCGFLVPFGDTAAIAARCVDALRGDWNPDRLRARAREFSYSRFQDRLCREFSA